MNYIVYTTEGYTESPNKTHVENCQILDFVDDINIFSPEAFRILGFTEEKMQIVASVSKEELSAISQIVNYLWDEEKRHYEECEESDRENHIFNHLRMLKSHLNQPTE